MNARTFATYDELKLCFDDVLDDLDLFQNPYTVTPSGIVWNDLADIASEGLWELGKTLVKNASFGKIAFPKIKVLKNGIALAVRSNERNHLYVAHYHLYHNEEEVGEVAVDSKYKREVDWNADGYYQRYKESRDYIYANKDLLTEIYFATDGVQRKELAKKLP